MSVNTYFWHYIEETSFHCSLHIMFIDLMQIPAPWVWLDLPTSGFVSFPSTRVQCGIRSFSLCHWLLSPAGSLWDCLQNKIQVLNLSYKSFHHLVPTCSFSYTSCLFPPRSHFIYIETHAHTCMHTHTHSNIHTPQNSATSCSCGISNFPMKAPAGYYSLPSKCRFFLSLPPTDFFESQKYRETCTHTRTKRERKRDCLFTWSHPNGHNSWSWSEARSSGVSHGRCRSPRTWTIFHHFPKVILRELDHKMSQDMNQLPYQMLAPHSEYWLTMPLHQHC